MMSVTAGLDGPGVPCFISDVGVGDIGVGVGGAGLGVGVASVIRVGVGPTDPPAGPQQVVITKNVRRAIAATNFLIAIPFF